MATRNHGDLKTSAERTAPGPVGAPGPEAPGAAASGVVAQTRGLSRSFAGHVVLDDLDLEIRSGEFVAMIGRSGTGKSTLLRALAGLDRDVTGDVVVSDPVSVVFQEPRLVPWKRVWANVSLGLRTAEQQLVTAFYKAGLIPASVNMSDYTVSTYNDTVTGGSS